MSFFPLLRVNSLRLHSRDKNSTPTKGPFKPSESGSEIEKDQRSEKNRRKNDKCQRKFSLLLGANGPLNLRHVSLTLASPGGG